MIAFVEQQGSAAFAFTDPATGAAFHLRDFRPPAGRHHERRNARADHCRDRGDRMSFFPQIGAGSVAQFPLTRSRKWRAITNNLESSEQIILPDTTGESDRMAVVLSGSDRHGSGRPQHSVHVVSGIFATRLLLSIRWQTFSDGAKISPNRAGRLDCYRTPAAWAIRSERKGRGRFQIRAREPRHSRRPWRYRQLCRMLQRLSAECCGRCGDAGSRWNPGDGSRRPGLATGFLKQRRCRRGDSIRVFN